MKPRNFNQRIQARRQRALAYLFGKKNKTEQQKQEMEILRIRLGRGIDPIITKKHMATASFARREHHNQRAKITR